MPTTPYLAILLTTLLLVLPGSAFASNDGLGQVISPGTFEYDGNLDVAGQDRDGAVGGSDYNDPFFDDWNEKPQPQEKKPDNKEMEFDYTAGVTYDMNPGAPKVQAPPVTIDDPDIKPPVSATKDKKTPAKQEMEFDYTVGVNFDMNTGGKPVKTAPLTVDDPVDPPSLDKYDPTEDEAPDGELGDGESVL